MFFFLLLQYEKYLSMNIGIFYTLSYCFSFVRAEKHDTFEYQVNLIVQKLILDIQICKKSAQQSLQKDV